ncbi:MAG: hypothetical protein Kow0010_10830 [Dehalococcoidia bacterium]
MWLAMANLLLETLVVGAQLLLAFFAFWLAWQTLLPVLPGPAQESKRIAPYAGFFTGPVVEPILRWLGLPRWLASACLLVVLAATEVALSRVPDLI